MSDPPPAATAHSYRAAWWVWLLGAGVGVLLLGGGLVGAGFLLLRGLRPAAGPPPWLLLWVLVPVALGAWLLLHLARSRLTLTDSALELQGAFRRQQLAWADISGRRTLRSQYGSYIELVPLRAGLRPLKIMPGSFRTDAYFDNWLAAIPDLEERERAAFEARVAADTELGATSEERLERLKRARRNANYLSIGSGAAAAWLYIYPVPYGLAVLVTAALPWVAVALTRRSHGLYCLVAARSDPRPNLGIMVFAPGLALLARAVRDVSVLDWQAALLLAAALAALLALVAWRASPTQAPGRGAAGLLVGVLLGGLMYGWGTVTLGNALLDGSRVQRYRVAVLAQHVGHGGRGGPSFHLQLAPWAARAAAHDESVSRALYEYAAQQHAVCIRAGAGALHLRWYALQSCPPAG
jgi:hypothetical protein